MKETKSMDIVDFAQVKLNMLYSISYKKDESNQLERNGYSRGCYYSSIGTVMDGVNQSQEQSWM